MLLLKVGIRHVFHWIVVAGLLIVAHTVTSDRNELNQDTSASWGTQLGLTEMPNQSVAATE